MMVFVAHPVAGVHRVPAEWLDGFIPSGFREATPAEIMRWHDERDLEPPTLPGEPVSPAGESSHGGSGRGPLPSLPDAGGLSPAAALPAA